MNRSFVENTTIAIAAIVLGVMAGFFWTYTFNVNLALLEVDGATYATIQSLLNENVRHPMFFLFFFGGGASTFLALIGNWRERRTISFGLLAAACLIYIAGVIVFTAAVNLPLNYATESWDPQNVPAHWETVRTQWNNANAIRVGTSLTAFVLTLFALVTRASAQKG